MTKKAQEIWLCLRFTHLSLNSQGYSACSDDCLAVSYQQQIWQCNEHASKALLSSGMSINYALMLAPQLRLIERDLALEAKKLQQLSHWAYQYTSLVSIKDDHTLLLELKGSRIKGN